MKYYCLTALQAGLFLLVLCFPIQHVCAQEEVGNQIVGIKVLQDRDTTIFMPKCNGDCPPSILNRYLFEWELGDCAMGFGNVVRHVYTETPVGEVRLRALSIYDEDEDPELIPIVVEGPVVAPLALRTFRPRAEFSRAPVPGDRIQVAVTLDHNFDPGELLGSLTVVELSGLLEDVELDTSRIARCGKLSLAGASTSGDKVVLDSLENLQNGPTTLLFGYDIPPDLEVGKDSIIFRVNFTGTGAGTAIDTTLIVSAIVKGSHDPNTKEAFPPEYFLPGDYITYTVHFQNIGLAPASQVVISDFLDTMFVIKSVEVLRTEIAGKPKKFEVEIVDRQLIFSFKGKRGRKGEGRRKRSAILAPASVNEKESKGLVEFRVKTRDTIGCFDHLANAAAIVFDNNPAFVTRCVVHKRFCDCQEYCNYLRGHGRPEFPGKHSFLEPEPTVPVRATGADARLQRVRPEEMPMISPEPETPVLPENFWDWKNILLLVAGLIILVQLLPRLLN